MGYRHNSNAVRVEEETPVIGGYLPFLNHCRRLTEDFITYARMPPGSIEITGTFQDTSHSHGDEARHEPSYVLREGKNRKKVKGSFVAPLNEIPSDASCHLCKDLFEMMNGSDIFNKEKGGFCKISIKERELRIYERQSSVLVEPVLLPEFG